MKKEIPLKESFKYPSMLSVRVTPDIKKKVNMLKDMGVDVGKLMRGTLSDAIDDAISILDSKVN